MKHDDAFLAPLAVNGLMSYAYKALNGFYFLVVINGTVVVSVSVVVEYVHVDQDHLHTVQVLRAEVRDAVLVLTLAHIQDLHVSFQLFISVLLS